MFFLLGAVLEEDEAAHRVRDELAREAPWGFPKYFYKGAILVMYFNKSKFSQFTRNSTNSKSFRKFTVTFINEIVV